jgi:hypothetical protein
MSLFFFTRPAGPLLNQMEPHSTRQFSAETKARRVHSDTSRINRLNRDVWSHVTKFLGLPGVCNLDTVCKCVRQWMIKSGVWRKIPLVWNLSERAAPPPQKGEGEPELSRLLHLKGFRSLVLNIQTFMSGCPGNLFNVQHNKVTSLCVFTRVDEARLLHLTLAFPNLKSLTIKKPAIEEMGWWWDYDTSRFYSALQAPDGLPPGYNTLRKLELRNTLHGTTCWLHINSFTQLEELTVLRVFGLERLRGDFLTTLTLLEPLMGSVAASLTHLPKLTSLVIDYRDTMHINFDLKDFESICAMKQLTDIHLILSDHVCVSTDSSLVNRATAVFPSIPHLTVQWLPL